MAEAPPIEPHVSRGNMLRLLAMCALLGSDLLSVARSAPPGTTDPTFERWCSHCHRAGIYMAGTAGLQAKYQGSKPALLEKRTDLTVELVKAYVRHGSNSMAPFRKTEISDQELEQLARYLANSQP